MSIQNKREKIKNKRVKGCYSVMVKLLFSLISSLCLLLIGTWRMRSRRVTFDLHHLCHHFSNKEDKIWYSCSRFFVLVSLRIYWGRQRKGRVRRLRRDQRVIQSPVNHLLVVFEFYFF